MSSPAPSLHNSTATAACTTMNNVTPCDRASPASPACTPAGTCNGTAYPAVAGHRRARPVSGQRQLRRRARQRVPPPGHLLRQQTARILRLAEQLPLPDRVIGILHRQRLPARCPALPPSRIRGAQVPRKNPHRPAIGGDVMDHQHQHMHTRADRQQPRPHRDTRPQVERPGRDPRRRFAPGPPPPPVSPAGPSPAPPCPGPAGTAARPLARTRCAAPRAGRSHHPAPPPARRTSRSPSSRSASGLL